VATSLRDLFDELERALRADVDQRSSDDAVAALAHLGRGLTRLVNDGLRHDGEGSEALAVAELATACHAASRAWTGLPHARVSDLTGAAADVVGRIRGELGGNERWAAAIELSVTARRCARFAEAHAPYAGVPQLARVRRLASAVEQLAAAHPPEPGRVAALDRLIPIAGLPAGLPGSRIAAESSAVVADQLRRRSEDPSRPPVRLVDVLAVLLAAESTAHYATSIAATYDHQTLERDEARTADGWRAVRHALDPFDDGTRHHPGPVSTLILWAVRQHEGLRREFAPATATTTADPTSGPHAPRVLTDLRLAVNPLPSIAASLHRVVGRWARRGDLTARANDLDPTDQRVAAILAGRTVTVDAVDLTDGLDALRTARLLSTALAARLDTVAGTIGEHLQAHLAASHTAELASLRVAQDLANRARLLSLATPSTRRTPHVPTRGEPSRGPRP
jgi:hypothetical protein